MLYTARISEVSRRVMEEHSKDLKVRQEQSRTIAGSWTKKVLYRHQRFVQTFWMRWCEGSYVGSTQVVKNKTLWASEEEEVDILVSCRAIRSGGWGRKQGQSMQRSFGGFNKACS